MTTGSKTLLAAAISGMIGSVAAGAAEVPTSGGDVMTVPSGAVPASWLDRRVSVDQAEADHPGITDERVARFPEAAGPFGFQNVRWTALKTAMKPGDELWTFASPPDAWRHLAGQAGIALVRDGRVVDVMVTLRN